MEWARVAIRVIKKCTSIEKLLFPTPIDVHASFVKNGHWFVIYKISVKISLNFSSCNKARSWQLEHRRRTELGLSKKQTCIFGVKPAPNTLFRRIR